MTSLARAVGRGIAQWRRAARDVVLWSVDFGALWDSGGGKSTPDGLGFERGSVATVQTGTAEVVTSIPAGVMRAGRALDSDGFRLVFEEERTNRVPNARAIGAIAAPGSSLTSNESAGPDGQVLADRIQMPSGQVDGYAYLVGLPVSDYVGSAWLKPAPASGSSVQSLGPGSGQTLAAVASPAAAWRRYVHRHGVAYDTFLVAGADARDRTGATPAGLTARDLDQVQDMAQLEAGYFATEVIETAGMAATRAGERLYHTNARALVDRGRIGLWVSLQPKGSSAEYERPMRLWTLDASNYAEVDHSTLAVRVVIDGEEYLSDAGMAWAADDLVDLWVEAGGSLATQAFYRVNGGVAVKLNSTVTPQGAVTASSGAEMDLLCDGADNQFTARVASIASYAFNRRPDWAVA